MHYLPADHLTDNINSKCLLKIEAVGDSTRNDGLGDSCRQIRFLTGIQTNKQKSTSTAS